MGTKNSLLILFVEDHHIGVKVVHGSHWHKGQIVIYMYLAVHLDIIHLCDVCVLLINSWFRIWELKYFISLNELFEHIYCSQDIIYNKNRICNACQYSY